MAGEAGHHSMMTGKKGQTCQLLRTFECFGTNMSIFQQIGSQGPAAGRCLKKISVAVLVMRC
jgi:hypothetical protein